MTRYSDDYPELDKVLKVNSRPLFGGLHRDYLADELQQEIEKSIRHREHKPRATDEV